MSAVLIVLTHSIAVTCGFVLAAICQAAKRADELDNGP